MNRLLTPYFVLQFLHLPPKNIYESTGTSSFQERTVPQERHLLRDFTIGATLSLVTITFTKLPSAEP